MAEPANDQARMTVGTIQLEDGRKFQWMMNGTTVPEIYGWIEHDGHIQTGTQGCWRTTDPEQAARRCLDLFPIAI